VVCFRPRVLRLWRRSCPYALRRGLGGPQNPPKPCAEEKNLFLVSGIELWFICCVFHSLISIPAEHLTQNNSTKRGGANNSRIYSIVAGETCSFPGGGVRLSQLGTLATNWPIVLAPGDRWWVWSSRWKENLQRKPKYSEKTCPNATLSTTNPTWLDLSSNPGRRVGNPTTNLLSYGTVLVKPVTILLRAAGFWHREFRGRCFTVYQYERKFTAVSNTLHGVEFNHCRSFGRMWLRSLLETAARGCLQIACWKESRELIGRK
jgi:hypothetical protein